MSPFSQTPDAGCFPLTQRKSRQKPTAGSAGRRGQRLTGPRPRRSDPRRAPLRHRPRQRASPTAAPPGGGRGPRSSLLRRPSGRGPRKKCLQTPPEARRPQPMTQGPEPLPRQTASPSQAPPPARWGQSQRGPTPRGAPPPDAPPGPQQALGPVPRRAGGGFWLDPEHPQGVCSGETLESGLKPGGPAGLSSRVPPPGGRLHVNLCPCVPGDLC